jgi:hypothetical protein
MKNGLGTAAHVKYYLHKDPMMLRITNDDMAETPWDETTSDHAPIKGTVCNISFASWNVLSRQRAEIYRRTEIDMKNQDLSQRLGHAQFAREPYHKRMQEQTTLIMQMVKENRVVCLQDVCVELYNHINSVALETNVPIESRKSSIDDETFNLTVWKSDVFREQGTTKVDLSPRCVFGGSFELVRLCNILTPQISAVVCNIRIVSGGNAQFSHWLKLQTEKIIVVGDFALTCLHVDESCSIDRISSYYSDKRFLFYIPFETDGVSSVNRWENVKDSFFMLDRPDHIMIYDCKSKKTVSSSYSFSSSTSSSSYSFSSCS